MDTLLVFEIEPNAWKASVSHDEPNFFLVGQIDGRVREDDFIGVARHHGVLELLECRIIARRRARLVGCDGRELLLRASGPEMSGISSPHALEIGDRLVVRPQRHFVKIY